MGITHYGNGIKIRHYDGNISLQPVPTGVSGSFKVPDPVTYILATSFAGCNKLTSIHIGDRVNKIASKAFNRCGSLEKIIVSRDNKHFANDRHGVLFQRTGLWLLGAPRKLSGMYVMPTGVKQIEQGAFSGCSELTTLVIAQSVTYIGKEAFENCTGLVHLRIPKNVTTIGAGAFAGCTGLCGITVAADNEAFKTTPDGALYSIDGTMLLYVPPTVQGKFQVPDEVIQIADKAFYGCKDLTQIVLPDRLEKIGPNTFQGCTSLETVYAPTMMYFDWHILDCCENLKNKCMRDPNGLLYNADPVEITRVWKKIEVASVRTGVARIPSRTFAGCTLLRTVCLPDTLTELGQLPFTGCPQLAEFRVSSKNPRFYTDEYGILFEKMNSNRVLQRFPTLLGSSYRIPDGVTHIAAGAFEGCVNLTALMLPKSLFSIQPNAFAGCVNLQRLAMHTVPIGCQPTLFADCPNLTLYGPEGSDVERFAKMHGIAFVVKEM